MQQPLPVPDEYDGDVEAVPGPPVPSLTPEQVAEQSALEVFPGAAELASDEWWQPPESIGEEDAPIEPDAEPIEPLELPPRLDETPAAPATPFAIADDWVEPTLDDAPTDEPAPEPVTRQIWSTPEPAPAVAEEPLYAAQTDETPEIAAVPAAPREAEDIPRSVLSLPLLSGREQRSAAGASQREQIMAQAGVVAEPIANDATSSADAQLAVAMGGPAAAGAADRPKGGRFTRKMRLSLIVIALTAVSLWGGAVAAGQGADVERGASALAPDVIERWISDQVSSLSGGAPAPTVDAPGAVPGSGGAVPGSGGAASDPALFGQIAHTGGSGVPVRSTCVVEARTPRVINEGAPVTVIARGVGDCSGWNVVRAGATVSWVESAYVEPISAP